MGELFNSPHEWVGLMSERLIDFIRVHISQIGGLSVARKIAALGEWFNVRSAWHGPGDVSPVGHAANAHLDLAIWNFGIQESVSFNDRTREVFPGSPTLEKGYMHINEAPGFGVDLNEELAAKYPLPDESGLLGAHPKTRRHRRAAVMQGTPGAAHEICDFDCVGHDRLVPRFCVRTNLACGRRYERQHRQRDSASDGCVGRDTDGGQAAGTGIPARAFGRTDVCPGASRRGQAGDFGRETQPVWTGRAGRSRCSIAPKGPCCGHGTGCPIVPTILPVPPGCRPATSRSGGTGSWCWMPSLIWASGRYGR